MSRSLRDRLTWSYLAVVWPAMLLMAVLVWRAVESQYLETQRQNLLAQASTTAAALQGQPLPEAGGAYSQASNAIPGIHTRLVGEQGVVVPLDGAPSDQLAVLPPAEQGGVVTYADLVRRSEIAQALSGQPASAVRRVGADRRRVLYAAVPLSAADGQVNGVVYLAMPLPPGGLPLPWLLQIGGALLAACLLAALSGMYLARRVARPIEQVAAAAFDLSQGDLSRRVSLDSGTRELDHLGAAFDHMAEQVQRSDQARTAFLADVTHELRTPLTVIKGTLETLEDGALDDPQGRGPLLAGMRSETERLIRLVNDLLLLARADAGSLELERLPVDLDALARRRCQRLGALSGQRQVTLEVVGDPQATWVIGDTDRLAQALDNLLDNALRYSPPGGRVQVELRRAGEQVACTVADQGPGIPAEHLPFIFERFYRADASRRREAGQSGGAGLGLAITRSLAQAQGGRIEVESQPGSGTRFTLWLPALSTNCPPPDTNLTPS